MSSACVLLFFKFNLNAKTYLIPTWKISVQFEFGLVESSITAVATSSYNTFSCKIQATTYNSTKLINFDQYNSKGRIVVGSCRRYDTSGFFSKESRITKYAMIKRLDEQKANQNVGSREASNLESL